MSKYTPHTDKEISQMLAELGLKSLDDLYVDVPRSIFYGKDLPIGEGLTQYEVAKKLKSLAEVNAQYDTVLRGGGIYDHVIPPVVNALVNREEFVTAYTPYQPEISQGILQAIFEYQTMMSELTGMDVSNASVYDGATAVAEAIVMCCERKSKAVILGQLNPQYMAVANTYCKAHNLTLTFVDAVDGLVDVAKVAEAIDENTACVVAQNPNYFGLLEDMEAIAEVAHGKGAKFIYVFNPIAAAILPTPNECGADVAVGEGQCLGLPMAYGGATLGIMTVTKAMSRRIPGRIVGQTTDNRGQRCFVLTLQAREQHIRREKALSSICSNQALNALTATVYLSTVGKQGLVEIAHQCVDKAHYLADKLVKAGAKLAYSGEFFNEFVVENYPEKAMKLLKIEKVLGGLAAPKGTLWCVTEKADKSKLDLVVRAFTEARDEVDF